MFAYQTWPVRCVASYLRNVHGGLARWRFVDYAVQATRKHGPHMGVVRVKTRYGFKMELHLHDWVDQHIYATGNYEDSTAATIAALLSEGDFSIDIGANIGFLTLLMARCVGTTGSVWSFEPCPPTRERLRRNLALNHAAHVTVREEAVSCEDGATTFYGGTNNHSGLACLRPLHAASASYQVRTARLTELLAHGVKPRLIKMDIEGAEHLALRGMTDLLEEHHPDLILEMSDHYLGEMGSSSAEVYALLAQCGYRMYRIDWDGLIAHERWDKSLPTQFNALFTTRPTLPERLPVKTAEW